MITSSLRSLHTLGRSVLPNMHTSTPDPDLSHVVVPPVHRTWLLSCLHVLYLPWDILSVVLCFHQVQYSMPCLLYSPCYQFRLTFYYWTIHSNTRCVTLKVWFDSLRDGFPSPLRPVHPPVKNHMCKENIHTCPRQKSYMSLCGDCPSGYVNDGDTGCKGQRWVWCSCLEYE